MTVGLASAFILKYPSGVVGGMLLSVAGIAIWAPLSSKSGSSPGMASERSSAADKTSIDVARGYYNDQSG